LIGERCALPATAWGLVSAMPYSLNHEFCDYPQNIRKIAK
jgi:hypothetical protein